MRRACAAYTRVEFKLSFCDRSLFHCIIGSEHSSRHRLLSTLERREDGMTVTAEQYRSNGTVSSEHVPPAVGLIHDLGNLIQVASSAVEIVARKPNMPAESSEALARARTSLRQAGAFVRQTIGRAHLFSSEGTSVPECLSTVVALVEAMGDPGFVVSLEMEPGLPKVRCDSIGLQSAILNLVLNARDATANRGVVVILARWISQPETAPQAVEIRVMDTGIGMSHETVAKAFDPFFTTKSEGLGGIGLPMVETFVRGAGGDIFIESMLGFGTTVSLHLPAAGLAVEIDSVPAAVSSSG